MSNDLSCRATVGFLLDWAEGELPPAARGDVEAHFLVCPRCREFAISYLATPALVRRATEAALPAGVEERLRRRIAAARHDA